MNVTDEPRSKRGVADTMAKYGPRSTSW